MTTGTGEDHYFPPGRSVARMVHGERSVGLLYGQRALLVGALEPLTYTGTMLSTRAADKPFKRLAHANQGPDLMKGSSFALSSES